MAFLGLRHRGIISSGAALGFSGIKLPSSTEGYGPVNTYLSAAGITDTTEIAAVNQLYLDLTGNGNTPNNTNVWDELKAFYPISPTSSDAACYNLVDPTRLKLTPVNNMVHSTLGFQGESSSWLDTGGNTGTGYTLEGFVPDNEFTSEVNFCQFIHSSYSSSYQMGAYNGIGASYYTIRINSSTRRAYSGAPAGASIASTGTRVTVGVKNSTSDGGIQIYTTDISGNVVSAISGAGDPTIFPRLNASPENPSIRFILSGIINAQTLSIISGLSLTKTAGWANALSANQAEDLIRAIENYNNNVIIGGRS